MDFVFKMMNRPYICVGLPQSTVARRISFSCTPWILNQNDGFCNKNGESCIKNDGLCIQNDEFCRAEACRTSTESRRHSITAGSSAALPSGCANQEKTKEFCISKWWLLSKSNSALTCGRACPAMLCGFFCEFCINFASILYQKTVVFVIKTANYFYQQVQPACLLAHRTDAALR